MANYIKYESQYERKNSEERTASESLLTIHDNDNKKCTRASISVTQFHANDTSRLSLPVSPTPVLITYFLIKET